MLLERRHAADDPLVFKVGKVPLHRLLNLRAGLMKHPAQLLEDRPCKGGGLGNVSVDFGNAVLHRSQFSRCSAMLSLSSSSEPGATTAIDSWYRPLPYASRAGK